MSQFVQKSRANFIAKDLFIAFRKIPEIFEEQNNLRRQHHSTIVSELRSREKSKRIWLNSIRLQS